MPVYSKNLGCWISNTLIPVYDPYPDADPDYDAESDEIDYGTDEDSEDEDVHYIVRPGFPKQKTAIYSWQEEYAAIVFQRYWRSR